MHTVVRCGDVGQNGNGGHAHNDLFSFELSFGGEPFVVDPGTYSYTSDATQRNLFRSTAAHNTVVVADAEINPISPERLFELKQVARPLVHRFEESNDAVRLVASHDGYRRLDPPVVHRRTFELVGSRLVVEDVLTGPGDQRAALRIHLAPNVVVERTASGRFRLSVGSRSSSLRVAGADQIDVEDGWVSDCFGVRERAPVVVVRTSGPMARTSQVEFVADQVR